MSSPKSNKPKIVNGPGGYILQDVPHLVDYLPTYPNPLQDNPAYSVVKQYFVDADDSVPEKIVVHKDGPRGIHFRRAGPRQKVYFDSDEVHACIVTCGGLCPGLNTVIREIVSSLSCMYGVNRILGIDNTIPLDSKVVNDIHKRGGTILGTSRGIRRRGLKVSVVGIPKTIDNDIPVIDRSFGVDTAVEEAQRAINAAHVEAESNENGIGFVKLMGRYSGAGQDLMSKSMESNTLKDASSNKILKDAGLWLSQSIKGRFKKNKMVMNLKCIDPTYMNRAVPSSASDNVYCILLAQSAVHGAMAGYTGYTSGLVNGRQTYIPYYRITEKQNHVVITGRMWARLLSSTNQPSFLKKQSFLGPKDIPEEKKETPLPDCRDCNGVVDIPPVTKEITKSIAKKEKRGFLMVLSIADLMVVGVEDSMHVDVVELACTCR
ncbi:hypothetical protein Bca4012_025240 [Brassica carinata]